MKKFTRYFCIVSIFLMLPFAGCAPEQENWVEPTLPELEQQIEEFLQQDKHVTQEENNPEKDDPEKEKSPLFLSPKYCLAAAEIPKRHPYPQIEDFDSYEDYNAAYDLWWQDNFDRKTHIQAMQHATLDFSHQVSSTLLNAGSGENAVCSPANIYMALAMLAEVTEGESKNEILTLLGQSDIKSLRTTADTLWETMYNDDGASVCIPANALFLPDAEIYKEQTVNTVSEKYHADLFRGKMGSDEYDKILQEWLNYQTRGLLEKQAHSIATNKDTLMVLASSLYFSNKWDSTFSKEANFTAPFYGSKGQTKATFMKRSAIGTFYTGERFEAVTKNFEMDGNMWFILPKESENIQDVLSDKEYLQVIEQKDQSRVSHPIVHLSLPKFDITSTLDLKEALPKMGIKQVFHINQADFTPLTDYPCYLDSARHDARVMIDEEGCKAAAFTVMALNGASAAKPEEIEFTLNRPFIFLIQYHGVILFAGVVQNL